VPPLEGALAYSILAADINYFLPCLYLLHDADYLLLCELAPFHLEFSFLIVLFYRHSEFTTGSRAVQPSIVPHEA
jgi:hypothetical protein